MRDHLNPPSARRRPGASRHHVVAAFVLVLGAACADDTAGPASVPLAQVASVEYVGTRAALYLQAGPAPRTRVAFTGATDPIPGNSPFVPPVRDENLLALGPLAWSPDGGRLALVATVANDQSELVVLDANGTGARVASVNSQIILSDPDWSGDGTRLVYAMSTGPAASGVELFLTDLTTNRVQQLTRDRKYRAPGGTVRFAAGGGAVLFGTVVGESGGALFEKQSEVWRLDLSSGTATRVALVAGTVQGIARSGAWALVLKRKALVGTDYESMLVRESLAGPGTPTVLVDGGRLHYARLTSDDARAMVVRNEAVAPGENSPGYYTLPVDGGPLVAVRGTGRSTVAASVHFP